MKKRKRRRGGGFWLWALESSLDEGISRDHEKKAMHNALCTGILQLAQGTQLEYQEQNQSESQPPAPHQGHVLYFSRVSVS